MAWMIKCTFGRIQSYAQAVKAWQKGVIFRKDDPPQAPRGLVDKRKKHLAIERTEAGDIILRLYDHPTVTWHKDGSLTLCGYNSKSTGKFATHCTPPGFYVMGGDRVHIDGRTYKLANKLTFYQDGDTWKVKDKSQIEPWSVPVVNRARAKQALEETGYKEFRLWLTTYVQMAASPQARSGGVVPDKKLIHMLRDRSMWRELVTYYPNAWRDPEQVLRSIRQAIYDSHGCIDKKSVPFWG